MYEISFLAIVLAAIASFILGHVWYHPRLFGAQWMRLVNVTPEHVEQGKRFMPLSALAAFVANLLVASVMDYLGVTLGVIDIAGAVQLALWCWIGFVVPTTLGTVLWEHRPLTLYLINASYWLVSFVVMAVVLLF